MRIQRLRRRNTFWQKINPFRPKLGRPKTPWPWRKFFLIFLGCFFGIPTLYGLFFLPNVKNAENLNFAESTIIYDRKALDPAEDPDKHILYIIHGDENREYVPLEKISPWVKKATLAIEDDQFYDHFGFDIGGISKAALNKIFGIGEKRGGSTITQQLVKQVFLSSERTILRKFKELLLAIKVEWHYSKDEILELYLNKISYGNNAYGIEAAARTYFDKSAQDLSIAEAAVLASIPQAPTRYNPYGTNKDLLMGFYDQTDSDNETNGIPLAEKTSDTAISETSETKPTADENSESVKKQKKEDKSRAYKKGRKDLVLERMLELGMITPDQFYQAWDESQQITFKHAKIDIKAPHFVFYVRDQLEQKYGKEFLSQGGLRIYTTLDPDLQTLAESVVATKTQNYKEKYGASNVAMTSINPDNGEILAYIGGKDFFDIENDGQVDVLTSRRQPGSSFKPIVYAAGFEKGYSPGSVVFDVPTDFGEGYKPQNFDAHFLGPISFREALNRSLNIPAVKMAFLATPEHVLSVAEKLGIKYEGNAKMHGVAIGIGVAEVEPLSLINAYQVFVNNGAYYEPQHILEIRNASGKVLEKINTQDSRKEGIPARFAALVRDILTDESTRPTTDGFDWNNFLQLQKFDNGAKTGTSNRIAKNPNFKNDQPESETNSKFMAVPADSWTIGFTPHLVTGVWGGNNRGQAMKPGASGMVVAASVWKDFMEKAHEVLVKAGADRQKGYPEINPPLVKRTINRYSGDLSNEKTPEHLKRTEVFASEFVPTQPDTSVITKTINIFTGKDAEAHTPDFAKKTVSSLRLKSLRPDLPAWNASVETWLSEHPLFLITLGAETDKTILDEATGEEKIEWMIPENFLNDLPPFIQKKIREILEKGEKVDWETLQAHSEEAPKIKITAPEIIRSVTEKIEVRVSYESKTPLEAVEYYFDETLLYKSRNAPFTGKFSIPVSADPKTEHIIRAVAIDQNLLSGEAKVSVKIQIDGNVSTPNSTKTASDVSSDLIFLSPKANDRFPMNSEIQILVSAKNTTLKKVEFFWDEKSLGTHTVSPFIQKVSVGDQRGRHHIKVVAEDALSNILENSIPVHVDREAIIRNKTPEISKIELLEDRLVVDLTFPEPEKIEKASFSVFVSEKPIYESEWTEISKFKQMIISKENQKGIATVKLRVQMKGESMQDADTKTTDL